MTGNMRRLARAAASLFGLGALVGGVPALLITVVGWPLPHGVPSLDDIRTAVGDGWRPDERFMFGLLALVVWVVWAQLVRHVLSQLRWQLRAQRDAAAGDLSPAPHVVFAPGGRRTLSQRIAGWLVGGLMMAAPLVPSASMAAPAPRIPVVLSVTNAMADALVSPPGGGQAAVSTTTAEARAPSYVVHTWEERRDCLWNIAERYLGDPFRWTEIRDLNADRVQSDGRRLGEDPSSWVYPGWELLLPSDAAGAEVVPAQAAAAPAPAGPAGAPAPAPTLSAPTTAPAAAPPAPTPTAAPSTTTPTPTTAAAATSTSSTTTARAAASVTPAPPASTAPASPTTAPARSTGSGSVVSVNPWATRAAMAGALGLPIFALGGWLTRLRRGRAAQASRARPGRDVVRTEPAVEPLERQARAIAADQAEEWIDAALRALTGALADAALETSPRLRCVRAGDMGLEVLLADPFPLAPEGWEAADGGHVWRVPDDVDLAELQRRGAEQPVVAPALVSLGATPEGPILADLEAFGALSVEGDAERVRAFLSGAALELASASWAQGVDLRVYGLDGFARLEGVVVDGEELLREVRSTAELVAEGLMADGLDAAASSLTARVGGPAGPQPWYPMVVLVGPDADREVTAQLVEVAAARTGVAVAGAGPFVAAGWQLVVGTEGTAVLKPLGLDVRMAGVAEQASPAAPDAAAASDNGSSAAGVTTNGHRPDVPLSDVAGVIGTDPSVLQEQVSPTDEAVVVVDQGGLDEGAVTTAVNALAAVDQMDDVAAPIPFAPQSKAGRPTLRRRQDCEVWVSILRRKPEVTGWAKEPRARVRLVEVLVYLAIYGQERPIPAGELRTECWPPELAPTGPGERERLQEITVDTFHQAMSRLRKQLGEGAMGWHLPMAVHGTYVPGPGVGCDWTLFQALAALGAEAAARHETAKAIRLYSEALDLVEGQPFADVPPGSHVWVETEHLDTDIRLAVSHVASQLAEIAMPTDPEKALWATQQGRLLLPTQLNLFDTWMMAAAELGDANGIDQAFQAKTWAYGQLDPDAGVPQETMELYRHLMAKVNGRDRVGQSQSGRA